MSSAVTSAPGGESATTSEDSARQLRLRVLNDIRDGKVFRFPNGVLTVSDNTQVEPHEHADYIAGVRLLDAHAWVMECTGINRYDRDHLAVRLRLTTLGEVGLDRLEQALAVAS